MADDEEPVAVYFVRSDAESGCLACAFSVERLVEMLHAGRLVWCWPHAQAAIAHGDRLTGQPLRVVR